MNGDGQDRNVAADGAVLRWPSRVITGEDLRRSLNGQKELVVPSQAVITPLAAEELRANGIRVTREQIEQPPASASGWGYAQDRPDSFVKSVVQALTRDGLPLKELRAKHEAAPCQWARSVAECVASGECQAGVAFCQDAGLLCCVANKVAGVRAVAVMTIPQALRAQQALGANLLAVEMAGRTFFEVRQILRTACLRGNAGCPAEVAGTLRELDGHAHR